MTAAGRGGGPLVLSRRIEVALSEREMIMTGVEKGLEVSLARRNTVTAEAAQHAGGAHPFAEDHRGSERSTSKLA